MDQPTTTEAVTGVPDAIPNREISIKDAMRITGMSLGQIYAAIRRGELSKVKGRRPIRIMLSEALRHRDNPPRRGRKAQPKAPEEIPAAETTNGHP